MPFRVLLLRKEFSFRSDVLYARSTGYERYFAIINFCTRLAVGNNNQSSSFITTRKPGDFHPSEGHSSSRLRLAQGFQSPRILQRKRSLLFRGVSVF